MVGCQVVFICGEAYFLNGILWRLITLAGVFIPGCVGLWRFHSVPCEGLGFAVLLSVLRLCAGMIFGWLPVIAFALLSGLSFRYPLPWLFLWLVGFVWRTLVEYLAH